MGKSQRNDGQDEGLQPYSFSLPASLVARLDRMAKKQNRTRSNMVVVLLTEAVDNIEVLARMEK